MPETILRASTPAQLNASLAALDIFVPRRSEGRQTHHVERYCIAHLLATLASAQRLSFPLTLTHGDRPDFHLAMSGVDVGIEHTEAVPENVARSAVLRDKEARGSDVYYTPRAIPGEPRKTAQELRRDIVADAPGDGWCGDSPEREWANAIAHYVGEKLPKAMAAGFVRYPTNWLIIYDNWPLPTIDHVKASMRLVPLLAKMNAFSVFDTIFVQDEVYILEFHDTLVIHALFRPDVERHSGLSVLSASK